MIYLAAALFAFNACVSFFVGWQVLPPRRFSVVPAQSGGQVARSAQPWRAHRRIFDVQDDRRRILGLWSCDAGAQHRAFARIASGAVRLADLRRGFSRPRHLRDARGRSLSPRQRRADAAGLHHRHDSPRRVYSRAFGLRRAIGGARALPRLRQLLLDLPEPLLAKKHLGADVKGGKAEGAAVGAAKP